MRRRSLILLLLLFVFILFFFNVIYPFHTVSGPSCSPAAHLSLSELSVQTVEYMSLNILPHYLSI